MSIDEAATNSDALLVLTEWNDFKDADPVALADLVASPIVIDARNCLDAHAWRTAGWTLTGLGTAPPPLLGYAPPLVLGSGRRLVGAR